MLTRLQGLVMIVNTLLPLALLLGITVAFVSWKGVFEERWQTVEPQLVAIRDSANQSVILVQATADRVTTHLASAGEGLDAVGKEFAKAAVTVEPVLQTMEQITVPGLKVTTIHKAICGHQLKFGKKPKPINCWPQVTLTESRFGETLAKPFRDAYGVMATAAQPLTDVKLALDELGVLGQLPEKAEQAQAALGIVATEALRLADPLGAILEACGYIAIFLLVWFGVQFVVRGAGQLRDGFRLLAGGDVKAA